MTFRLAAGVVALVLIGALAGCAPEPGSATPTSTEAETEKQTQTQPSTPTSEPPTASAALVVPACDELLPIDTVHQNLGDDRVELFPTPADRIDFLASETFGPVAVDAYGGAQQLTHCIWAYPQSDGVIDVIVAELTPEVRAAFVAALDDSVYVKRTTDMAVIYEDLDPERTKSMAVRHGFVGDIWVSTVGRLEPFFEPALERMAEVGRP